MDAFRRHGLFACALALLGACSSPRWKRHFEPSVWGGAFESQVTRPGRYVPEGALAATIPVSFVYDDDISAYYADKNLSEPAKHGADALQVVLPSIPILIGGAKWEGGDEGENFEVVAESLIGVVGIQQLIAHTVDRERPDHKDKTSFPSGHTSWAFASTTLIVRDMHDPGDSSFHAIDGFMYIPAMYSAWERLAINHHWASDVTCGALLGVLWVNLVWDVHYKADDETRPVVYGDQSRGIAWSPAIGVVDDNLAFGVRISF